MAKTHPPTSNRSASLAAGEPALQFPCRFPIKVFGKAAGEGAGEAADAFETLVVSAVRRHVPDLAEGAVVRRASRGGRFLSLTVTVNASSRDQLDAIYRALTELDDVLMAL